MDNMLKRWGIVFIFVLSILFPSTHSKANPIDDLLQITNPGLKEQMEHKQKEEEFKSYLIRIKNEKGKLVGTFSTPIKGRDSGGLHNIQLACKKLDGIILMPNEMFSFNEIVGDSNDPHFGWEISNVIVNQKLDKG
jgi:vancomycin resistance protein VanW